MTQYSDSKRAESLAVALAVGDKEASKRTGVPRRTLSRWRQEIREGSPRAEALMTAETREAVAAKLWQGVTVGTDEVIAGLRDPKARLGDKARALDTLATQHALMSGGPTARTETTVNRGRDEPPDEMSGIEWWEHALGGPLSDAQRRFLRDAIDQGHAWLGETILAELLAARDEGREPDEFDGADLVWTREHGRPTHYVPGRKSTYPQLTDGRNGQ